MMADWTVGRVLIPESITKAQFKAALDLYPSLIARISVEKKNAGKHMGQNKQDAKRMIIDLDKLRFEDFPAKYTRLAAEQKEVVPLEKDDIVLLVEWKLKHGTFRPGLLSMAAANPASTYKEVTRAAFHAYRASTPPSVKSGIKELSTLKGIGSATASLLLSMHDPERVVFFSDEAFIWLCRGGLKAKGGIKYNAKEYDELNEKAVEVMDRLGVGAREVEKVAFVLMRDDCAKVIEGAEEVKEEGKGEEKDEQKDEQKEEKTKTAKGKGKEVEEPRVDGGKADVDSDATIDGEDVNPPESETAKPSKRKYAVIPDLSEGTRRSKRTRG